MERFTVVQCRKLIGRPATDSLADESVIELRDMLYSLADVIADAFSDLENTDQTLFTPPGDVFDVFERRFKDFIENMVEGEAQ
jgi:hypothetical protein